MTSKSPRQLTAPKLEDYPFVTLMFRNDVNAFVAADGGNPMGDPELHGAMSETYFDWPSKIAPETLAILSTMTDATFNGLCSVLCPKYDDFAVKSKADLRELAERRQQYVKPDPEDGLGHYTLEQLESYLLFGSEYTRNVHWGNFTKLFNTCAADQQQAIEKFFDRYHGQGLDVLLSHAAKPIEIPEILKENFEAREHAGNIYHFSEEKEKWLREDRFHQQYRLDVTIDGSSFTFLRASAPTLRQAVVKATALALAGSDGIMGRVEILQGGVPVMHAEVIYSEKVVDGAPAPVPTAKLRWDFTNIGPEKKHLKANKRFNAMAANDYKSDSAKKELLDAAERLDALIDAKPPFPSHVLLKTVLDVEKKLKLQWSKVYRLEDDLGM